MKFFFVLLVLIFEASSASENNANKLIRDSMERSALGAKIEFIEPSEMEGLYTVGLQGGRIMYASDDGQFFFQGRLYKAKEGGTINLTDVQERQGMALAIEKVSDSEIVAFTADNERGVITVFTDTSCPFCHKLHEDIEELNDKGISVRYLAYPREGLDSQAYKILVSVWCSPDRNEVLEQAMANKSIDSLSCDNPVRSHFQLGQQMGVRGTPAIVFENGAMLNGYRSPDVLEKIVDSIQSGG